MGLFGKKEERKLPDLPTPREAGLSFGLESESHALPTFPDSPSHNKFSEAMIKDAVGSRQMPEIPSIPAPIGLPPVQKENKDEKKIKVVEVDEWQPSSEMDHEEDSHEEDKSSERRFMPPPERKPMRPEHVYSKSQDRIPRVQDRIKSPMIPPMKSHSQNEIGKKEVFVRIDRYYTARKAMSEIAAKLEEVDDMVRKIREVKLREEQEIAAWERDIMNAKERIQEVNANLFDKLE